MVLSFALRSASNWISLIPRSIKGCRRHRHDLALSELTALSGVDGRYGAKVIEVEVRWLQFMADQDVIPEVQPLSSSDKLILDKIITDFTVEYFLKEKASALSPELKKKSEWWHFACTSEDINNLAYGMMLKQAREDIVLPQMDHLIDAVTSMAHAEADSPLLARTHGQPATPTTMGKELANFAYRLRRQRDQFSSVEVQGKFNGAVGNYNAHVIVYPDADWPKLAQDFIEPHDMIAELFDPVKRYNSILLDMNRDMWGYIFRGEVGSSTMPHKVNPIDFENSEGNLGIANCIMSHLGEKLPISRFQRDCTDSTVLRSIGVGFAHSIIAYKAAIRGLGRVGVDQIALEQTLNNNWEVLAEPIQTPYEKLKTLTRGEKLGAEKMKLFVESLRNVYDEVDRLLKLTPSNYLGVAPQLARAV
eukprot:GSMAST32.ASY1.ANO1.951.1 assembled CDS